MAALNTYYNSRCPVCRPAIEMYAFADRSHDGDLQWCDINADEAALSHLGVTADQVRKLLHVIDGEGRLHVGVGAFEAIWSELEGYRWRAHLIRILGIRRLAGWIYEIVFLHRLSRRTLTRLYLLLLIQVTVDTADTLFQGAIRNLSSVDTLWGTRPSNV